MWLDRFRRKKVQHIFIYQCGKVGSSTLTATLKESAPALDIVQLHFMTPGYLKFFSDFIKAPGTPPAYAGSTQKLIDHGRKVRELLDQTPPSEVCIISGFRDPLDRAISALAQDFQHLYPELTFTAEKRQEEMCFVADEIEDLVEGTISGRPCEDFRTRQGVWQTVTCCLDWFDEEFGPALGVNMQKLNIGSKDLIQFRSKGRLCLLYRFETFQDTLPRLVNQLPIAEYREVGKNVSAQKVYGDFLRDFRKWYRPTRRVWDFYYTSPFYRQFYRAATPAFSCRDDGR